MYDKIPQKLKENEPFCLWRIENDKKVPYQINFSEVRTAKRLCS